MAKVHKISVKRIAYDAKRYELVGYLKKIL